MLPLLRARDTALFCPSILLLVPPKTLTWELIDLPTTLPSAPQAQRDIIFELRRIAFDAESDPSNVPGSGTEKRKAMYTKDYKMLGFTVSTECPPCPDSSPFIVLVLEQQAERGEGLCVWFALAVATQWV